MSRLKRKKSKFGTTIYNHIINNKREYLIITILFFIGLITAIFVINNLEETQMQEIHNYLNELFQSMDNYKNIDFLNLLKNSIIYNMTITLLLWFGASTIIGIPIVYGTIFVKGFSIGYTISSLVRILGAAKGIILSLAFLLLHNIILIPTIFAISVSGVKLYKSIMKNKQRDNIKLEILRHTIFCFIMLLVMLVSSIIETYLSTNIAIVLLKYIKF